MGCNSSKNDGANREDELGIQKKNESNFTSPSIKQTETTQSITNEPLTLVINPTAEVNSSPPSRSFSLGPMIVTYNPGEDAVVQEKVLASIELAGAYLNVIETDTSSTMASLNLLKDSINITYEMKSDDDYSLIVDDISIGCSLIIEGIDSSQGQSKKLRMLRDQLCSDQVMYRVDSKDPLVQLDFMVQKFQNSKLMNYDEMVHRTSSGQNQSLIKPPAMNIVILVVGTRGDVQPFVYLGQSLKKDGHRVRLATHAEYRGDVIKGGLEYYPLAGDPRKLSEYMVKTAGRLMPDLLSASERKELPEKMKMLEEITYSCFPACTAPDPEDPELKPFLADAIISNPVSYGHIHVAEAICVPLHIMFPQPWSPTKSFPHPLSNMSFENKSSLTNYYSFRVVDEFMWMGLGWMFNRFRSSLNLETIHVGENGADLLNANRVPISHMWSPSFVPKCPDWPDYVDVVGEFRPDNETARKFLIFNKEEARVSQILFALPVYEQGLIEKSLILINVVEATNASDFIVSEKQVSTFIPPEPLAKVLAAGDRPLYIGFGSMVIEDPTRLKNCIIEAASKIGCRVLLQSGWTKYADDYEMISPEVMVIGAMPHDYLFYQVSGVVHHGGAGTTSAGLRAGNPTFICPFFGDQNFWAEMVFRAGAGPKGCPISKLTSENLISAFEILRKIETQENAKKLSNEMLLENGVEEGKKSFYRNLPLDNMICEVSIFDHRKSKIAKVYCKDCDLKMCSEVDSVIHQLNGSRADHTRIHFRPSRWGIVRPKNAIDGLMGGLAVMAQEFAGGLYDVVAKPIEGAREGGLYGFAGGVACGIANSVYRPAKGGRVLVDRVINGTISNGDDSSSPTREMENKLRNYNRMGSVRVINAVDLVGISKLPVNYDENEIISTSFTQEEIETIEQAYGAATHFLFTVYNQIDNDGSRTISKEELKKYLPDSVDVENIMAAMDINSDGILTFTELAIHLGAAKE
eukprot:gene8948-12065_t